MKSLFISSLKRAFMSKWYIASIIATVIMCYVSSREYISDGTNSVYIIDLMIHLGMFKKVMVFFAAIPFVTVYCQDYNSGYIKSLIVRSSERNYAWSNVIVCALSGFTAVFAGMVAYFGIVSFFCPPQAYETAGVYSDVALNSPILYVLLIVGVFSLYATMWTIVGLTLSSVLPDNYVALGSPLIFGYILEEMTLGLPSYLNLYNLSHSFAVFDKSPLLNCFYTIGVFILIMAISGCAFSHFVKRRSRNEMV